MKNIILGLFVLITAFIGISSFQDKDNTVFEWNKKDTVSKVLSDLGEPKQKHDIKPTAEQIKKGEELVKVGYTTDANGRKTKLISKHYVCTSCHNLEREDPVLYESNAETRLPYVKEHKIPFLQGTTFWGITNRESWYNDDYVRKYGDEKISMANKDLRESIQLCAIECSQGRHMEDWEIENVLAYYTSLELKMSDLDLTENDWKKLQKDGNDASKKAATIKWLKSKYATKSPATFYDSPKDKKNGYEGTKPGNPAIGKDIYDLSCVFCHKANGGVSHYVLDDSKMSFKHLEYKMFRTSHMSIYQLIPYGTYAIPGHRPYMPHYPMERMTKQQVEDLRAYIVQQAK